MGKRTMQAGTLALASASRQAVSFVAVVVLTRVLPAGEYGKYSQYLLLLGLFVSIAPMGLTRTMLVTLPQNKYRERDVFFNNQLILLCIGSIVVLGMWLAKGYIAKTFSNNLFLDYMPFVCLSIFFACLSSSHASTMIYKGAYPLILALTFVTRSLWLGLVIFAALFSGLASKVVFASAISNIFTFIAGFIFVWIILKKSHHLFSWKLIKEEIKLGFPLGLSAVVGLIAVRLDKLLVASFYSVDYYAVFSVGALQLPLIGFVSTSAASIILPEIAQADTQEKRKNILFIWRRAILKSATILLPAMFFFLIFSQDTIVFLYSEKYRAAYIVFSLYLLSIPAKLISHSIFPIGNKKTGYVLTVEVIASGVNLFLGLVLIHIMGPIGVVIATIISLYGAVFIGYVPWMMRYFQCGFIELYPVKEICRFLLFLFVGSALLLVLRLYGGLTGGRGLIICGFLFGISSIIAAKYVAGVDWIDEFTFQIRKMFLRIK